MADRPWRRLHAQAEGGFAMVTVIGVLFLGLLLGAAAMEGVQPGVAAAVQDQHSRRAVQAALSGVEVAQRRMNGLDVDLATLLGGNIWNLCIGQVDASTVGGVSGTHVLTQTKVSSGSWCPPVTIDLGTGTTATYQVGPVTTTIQSSNLTLAAKLLEREIVVTGNADGAKRRVLVKMSALGSVKKSLGLVIGGTLAPYQVEQGSFRECRSVPVSSSAPDADC